MQHETDKSYFPNVTCLPTITLLSAEISRTRVLSGPIYPFPEYRPPNKPAGNAHNGVLLGVGRGRMRRCHVAKFMHDSRRRSLRFSQAISWQNCVLTGGRLPTPEGCAADRFYQCSIQGETMMREERSPSDSERLLQGCCFRRASSAGKRSFTGGPFIRQQG